MNNRRRILNYYKYFTAKRLGKKISKIKPKSYLGGFDNIEKFRQNTTFRQTNKFFFGANDLQFFKNEFRSSAGTTIKEADEICDHYFNLLGSGKRLTDTQLGKVDWHRDFKNEVNWDPSIFYTETEIIKDQLSDIKVPWELSRFQHLPTLGKAYILTSDDKYCEEYISQVNDWVASNSFLYGVNWTSTMDVAIRAINWIWGYYYFKDSSTISNKLLHEFLKNLYIHGNFIRANLDRKPKLWTFGISIIRRHPNFSVMRPDRHEPLNNHYIADLVGLIYLGVLFPEFKKHSNWLNLGVKELIREMKREVYPDGEDYEGSVSYHRLVTELYISSTLLCLKNDITFPDWYMKRLEKMLDFVMYYSKPDGTAPQIGDSDDGRLHIISNYGDWNRLDHRYLLSIGAVLFDRPDFKKAAGEFSEEAFFLLGQEGFDKFNRLPIPDEPVTSKAFKFGGYYFLRNKNLYMAVDCLNMSLKAPCGHKHNSRLSFELYAGDKSFIIDPGTYVYTADKGMRNLFRSSKYHNTIVVDEEEQNRFSADDLFNLERDSIVKINRWNTSEKQDILDAEHYGYKRLKQPVIHRRQVIFDKLNGYWKIIDILTGEGTHQLDCYFHLAPMNISVDKKFPFVIKTKTIGNNLVIIPIDTDGLSLEITEGYVSYQYGVRIKAPILKYTKNGRLPLTFETIFYPYDIDIDPEFVMEKTRK